MHVYADAMLLCHWSALSLPREYSSLIGGERSSHVSGNWRTLIRLSGRPLRGRPRIPTIFVCNKSLAPKGLTIKLCASVRLIAPGDRFREIWINPKSQNAFCRHVRLTRYSHSAQRTYHYLKRRAPRGSTSGERGMDEY